MTMLSFRVTEEDAQEVQTWSERLRIDRSELLREAVRRHLVHLAAERDIAAYLEQPFTDDEMALAAIADWGPMEDWSDWADAAG